MSMPLDGVASRKNVLFLQDKTFLVMSVMAKESRTLIIIPEFRCYIKTCGYLRCKDESPINDKLYRGA